MSRLILAADILFVLILFFLAQELSAAESKAIVVDGDHLSIEEKRNWVAENLDVVARSDREREVLSRRISTMSDRDVDRSFRAGQKQQINRRRLETREENATREAAGFQPVIVWLPSGTNFGASGVVSPDGRYVRTTAYPFFSSIGPVNTFTYQNGYRYPYRYHRHPGHVAYPLSGTTIVERRNPGVVGWQPSGSHSMGNRLGISPTRPRFLDDTGPQQR